MLARAGVRARSMQPAFPTLTFPNHYTLVTGLRPDQQGIVANSMRDPALGNFSLGNRATMSDDRWWAQGTPLCVTAGRVRLRAAITFWPGSEASIYGCRPDDWREFDGAVAPAARVRQVLAWLNLPAGERPAFLTLYFDAVDHAGPVDGPGSPQVGQALRDTNRAIALRLAGLHQRKRLDHINLIVLSDHGMAGVANGHHIASIR